VFTHLNKSGGSTVKAILKAYWGPRYCSFGAGKWEMGSSHSRLVAEILAHGHKWNVVGGGYAESLRRSSAVDAKCKWFTVFRHPIARMISAFNWCQKAPQDQTCATHVVDARQVDLTTFAKHWGNYAMRQFVLGLLSIDDVMEYSHADAVDETLPQAVNGTEGTSGWYLVKLYLENQNRAFKNDDIPEAGLCAMLQPVQDLLHDHYSAIGILEEYNTTLSLFNTALDMPGVDWHELFATVGRFTVNNNNSNDEKAAMLAEVSTNSEIKKYMQLDLLLYDYAVELFHQQARAYDI
ncbi:unnamed protein product, partial [Laminaria digitata]